MSLAMSPNESSGSVKVIEAPVFVGSDGGLPLTKDAQDGDWDRLVN